MFLRRAFRTLLLLCGVTAANAQIQVHIGVETGVPFTNTLSAFSTGSLSGTDYSFERYNSVTKRLLIGPALRLDLPKGLGFEFDAIYQRVNYDATNVVSIAEISYFYDSFEQAGANRWQFPLLAQYNRTIAKTKFFVEVGPSVTTFVNNHVTFTTTSALDTTVSTTTKSTVSWSASTLAGITTGVGVDLPLSHKHLRPEVRYSHWFSPNAAATSVGTGGGYAYFLTTSPMLLLSYPIQKNEVSFLLGLSF